VRKRTTLILLVILLAGLALLGYFLHKDRQGLLTDPYKIIAPNAFVVIETADIQSLFNSLTTGKGIFSELGKTEEFRSFDTKLKYIADQLNKPGLKKLVLEGKTLVSFHPAGQKKPVPFLSMTITPDVGFRQLRETLSSFGIKNIIEERSGSRRLFRLPYVLASLRDTVFVSISSGLLICSTSETLVLNALSQSQPHGDIRDAPGFARVMLATGRKEDKLFVVFSNLTDVIKPLFAPDARLLADKITRLGSSGGGDVFINDEGFTLSGYIESSDPGEYLFRYRNIVPRNLKNYRILPSGTSLFESMIMPGESQVRKKPEAGSNLLADKLRPYLGEEITRAYIDIKTVPVNDNTVIVIELKNPVQCEQIIREHADIRKETKYFQPDDQVKIPVYFTGKTGLVRQLVPELAPSFSDSYFTFYDNYMIIGSSEITLSRFLYDNILNKTLANDVFYREFEKLLPSRSGYFFYCNPPRIVDYLAQYLSPEIMDGIRKNRVAFNKLQSVGFQLASINDMIYNNISLRYRDQIMEESTTEWETLLDTAASIKPFFFRNHITGAREIFIQDMNNNAYLINATGRVLWKVPLKERIISTVYMIDYYRNGKFQLLFSGRNNLHVLDRNGNYVERYPVRLRSPATNSVALFDYDNNNTYRLVIAGEDKMIYSYDKSGNAVKGWKPFRTSGQVTSEAGFYRVSGKDFIVVADEASLYFLDRSGNIRLRLKDAVTKAAGSTIRLSPGSRPSLVCSSPQGEVQHIYFDGEVRKFSLRPFASDHSFDYFDIDGDGFGEYIFIEKGKLYLYDHDRSELFTKDFTTDNLGGPINFIFSASDRKIGVFDPGRKLIYLVDKKGEIMKGFPLRGASMFSINRLSSGNEWNLIVGGTDRFLYNYKLETGGK